MRVTADLDRIASRDQVRQLGRIRRTEVRPDDEQVLEVIPIKASRASRA